MVLAFEVKVESSVFEVVASCLGLKLKIRFDAQIWSLKSWLKVEKVEFKVWSRSFKYKFKVEVWRSSWSLQLNFKVKVWGQKFVVEVVVEALTWLLLPRTLGLVFDLNIAYLKQRTENFTEVRHISHVIYIFDSNSTTLIH